MNDPELHDFQRPAQHERTRRDHATETAEDYVEAMADILCRQSLCRGSDLTKRFNVSHVTVNRIVTRLRDLGLVETEPYGPITLTAKGRRVATRCRKRHETVFRFLLAIGVDQTTASLDAEGIEHHVSSETLKRFHEFVDRRGEA